LQRRNFADPQPGIAHQTDQRERQAIIAPAGLLSRPAHRVPRAVLERLRRMFDQIHPIVALAQDAITPR
jgi:hypothetical protein